MNSLLENLRLITLKSENLGKDWEELSLSIDDYLSAHGYELAEESIYFLYNKGPGAVLDGSGEALIARPVTGPKKVLEAPFQLLDMTAAPVHKETLTSTAWEPLLEECYSHWEKLQRKGLKLRPDFLLKLNRRVGKTFNVSAEVLFL